MLIMLRYYSTDVLLEVTDLLSIADKIHMVLVKTDPNSETHLISSQNIDWRTVLTTPAGKQTISVEMMGVGERVSVHMFFVLFQVMVI